MSQMVFLVSLSVVTSISMIYYLKSEGVELYIIRGFQTLICFLACQSLIKCLLRLGGLAMGQLQYEHLRRRLLFEFPANQRIHDASFSLVLYQPSWFCREELAVARWFLVVWSLVRSNVPQATICPNYQLEWLVSLFWFEIRSTLSDLWSVIWYKYLLVGAIVESLITLVPLELGQWMLLLTVKPRTTML